MPIARRSLLVGGAAFVTGAAAVALSNTRRSQDFDRIRRRAAAIAARNRIVIGYGTPQTFFVAPYTEKDAAISRGKATSVDLANLGPALNGIDDSLSIYPDGFFSRACRAIFVCGSLVLDGARAGGTYGPAWIILVASAESGAEGIFKTAHLGVHHEFSSLIWQKFPDLINLWQPLMPIGWQPARDNAEALAAAETGSADPATGFLTPYGRTSLENDFNVYAETAFAEPTRLRDLGRAHQVVAKKAGLLIAAYTAIDDRMHDVFAKLELAQFGSAFPQTLSEGYAVPAPTTMPQPSIVDHSETRTLKRKKP